MSWLQAAASCSGSSLQPQMAKGTARIRAPLALLPPLCCKAWHAASVSVLCAGAHSAWLAHLAAQHMALRIRHWLRCLPELLLNSAELSGAFQHPTAQRCPPEPLCLSF